MDMVTAYLENSGGAVFDIAATRVDSGGAMVLRSATQVVCGG
jgi:hypothetical protein